MNNFKKKFQIEIDIGGTKIKAILTNGKKTVSQINYPTPKSKNEFIKILTGIFQKFSTPENKRKIVKINIGCAGVVSGSKTILSPNIKYLKNFDFRLIFPKPLNLTVDNDARYFLEKKIKTITNYKIKKILAFTIGTGIGRAYAENGKIQKIKKFEYPEKWEEQYQKIRDTRINPALIQFLTKKFTPIIKKYNPDIIILAGGVIRRKGFLKKFTMNLLKME